MTSSCIFLYQIQDQHGAALPQEDLYAIWSDLEDEDLEVPQSAALHSLPYHPCLLHAFGQID